MSSLTAPLAASSAHPQPTLGFLQRHAYDPLDLASLVASQLGPANVQNHMQKVQHKLVEWQQAVFEYRADMESTGHVPSVLRMKHMIDLLGDILPFYKLLHVGFRWRRHMFTNGGELGVTTSGALTENGPLWVVIDMDPADLHVNSQTADHFTSIICTLLHECIHAFLRSYACKRQCARADCRPYKSRMGGSGHGSAFVIISTYVEAFAEDFLVENRQLRLGVVNSLLEEADNSGIVPSEAEIGMCHPDYQETLEKKVREAIASREPQ